MRATYIKSVFSITSSAAKVWKSLVCTSSGFLICAPLAVSIGCVTPYQPMGFTGGYKDAQIKSDLFFIEIVTNAFTSDTTAAKYFARRGFELCKEHGYQDFELVNLRDTSTSMVLASAGAGYASGGTVNKPGVAGYVRCTKPIDE